MGLEFSDMDRLARSLTRRIPNFHDREDACQEYFIAAWLALRTVREGSNACPYQHTCGRNAVYDFLNRLHRRPRPLSANRPFSVTDGGRDEALVDVLPETAPGPAEQAEVHELVEKLLALITRLAARQREVAEHMLAGLTTKEMSRLLGVSRQAIEQYRKLALENLRSGLTKRQVA